MVKLQKYVVSIDKFGLNILTEDYREKYFEKTLNEVYCNQGKIFLAKEENSIYGLIAGFVISYDEYDKIDYKCPKKATITELIVSENTREQNIGQQLLIFAEIYFKEIGCEYILIDVFAYNLSAEKFYNKNGYKNRMFQVFKKI